MITNNSVPQFSFTLQQHPVILELELIKFFKHIYSFVYLFNLNLECSQFYI